MNTGRDEWKLLAAADEAAIDLVGGAARMGPVARRILRIAAVRNDIVTMVEVRRRFSVDVLSMEMGSADGEVIRPLEDPYVFGCVPMSSRLRLLDGFRVIWYCRATGELCLCWSWCDVGESSSGPIGLNDITTKKDSSEQSLGNYCTVRILT